MRRLEAFAEMQKDNSKEFYTIKKNNGVKVEYAVIEGALQYKETGMNNYYPVDSKLVTLATIASACVV